MNEGGMSRQRAEASEFEGLGEIVIADLVRTGLLSPDRRSDMPKLRIADKSLPLFLPLLEQFDVRLVPMQRQRCPVHFCTGILKAPASVSSEAVQTQQSIPAGGQGDCLKNATISCLGELSERLSLCSLGDRDPRVFADQKEQPEVDFLKLLGLSASQQAVTARTLGQALPETQAGTPDWLGLSNRRIRITDFFGQEAAQAPSFAVLFQESERPKGGALSFASSVGCAVWPTHEGARERAFLELVERDAVALTWYNRLGISLLPRGFMCEILPAHLIDFLDTEPRNWGLFLLHTDLAVQVVMAVSYETGGRSCAFGSAAGWDIVSACQSALEELLQSENALSLMQKSYPEGETQERIPSQLAYARNKSIFEDLPLEAAQPAPEKVLTRVFNRNALEQSCLDRDISIWEFDATRPDLSIPCIKLLSPDLCTWEPRFGKKRLFESVVDWGMRAHPAREAEFATRPFPF